MRWSFGRFWLFQVKMLEVLLVDWSQTTLWLAVVVVKQELSGF
jgi:hypothetical protein